MSWHAAMIMDQSEFGLAREIASSGGAQIWQTFPEGVCGVV